MPEQTCKFVLLPAIEKGTPEERKDRALASLVDDAPNVPRGTIDQHGFTLTRPSLWRPFVLFLSQFMHLTKGLRDP